MVKYSPNCAKMFTLVLNLLGKHILSPIWAKNVNFTKIEKREEGPYCTLLFPFCINRGLQMPMLKMMGEVKVLLSRKIWLVVQSTLGLRGSLCSITRTYVYDQEKVACDE